MLEANEGPEALGPTFQCIIAEQFQRLKIGDRFWHENEADETLNTNRTAFNAAMLSEIRKTTFAKILCDNADSILNINPTVLQPSSSKRPCEALPKVDLRPWITPHRDSG